jgi:energy-coupling factor transporter ATP-binding protein EcfA2
MSYGIRVVLVMNRKGGSGKSTLCRALASAAAGRGETVTIFDTDSSKSCLKWMQVGQKLGNWSPLVEVIHALDAHRVAEAIDQSYEQRDQEHLILIDTFDGGLEAQDVLAVAAHRRICGTRYRMSCRRSACCRPMPRVADPFPKSPPMPPRLWRRCCARRSAWPQSHHRQTRVVDGDAAKAACDRALPGCG